ncbi:MAG TPA: hypothetical protein VLW50_25900, partial [Streptosporangiaceae bacterium]|nr:hypothetical protein [Streptosporangiaceae bacterium]
MSRTRSRARPARSQSRDVSVSVESTISLEHGLACRAAGLACQPGHLRKSGQRAGVPTSQRTASRAP